MNPFIDDSVVGKIGADDAGAEELIEIASAAETKGNPLGHLGDSGSGWQLP